MKIKIISIENPKPVRENGANLAPESHKHSKFIIRRKYVEDILFPQMKTIGDVELFSAITPDHFTTSVTNGITYGHYMDVKLEIGSGSFGNFISNFILWKECVSLDEPILILEDDASLPSENKDIIVNALKEYETNHKFDNSILYLQSQIPSHPTGLHSYQSRKNKNLLQLVSTADLSGTASYCVNPTVAKKLIEIALINKTVPTDCFIHTSQMNENIGVLFPEDYSRCFMLHCHFESWNHKHNPNI